MNKKISLIWIILLMFTSVQAELYYAESTIEVFDNGGVQISGMSNHPLLQERTTQELTSKKGNYWLLNLTIEGIFSDYLFEIRFPEGANINYMKIPNILSITNDAGKVVITSTGSNTKASVLAQYSINKTEQTRNWMFTILGIIILAGGVLFIIKKHVKIQKYNYNAAALTDRQKQILNLVIKNKGSIIQSALQKELNIPKASLSRNIETLIRKKILVKEQKGMTNVLLLKKE
ncbi:hypothetical protein COV11_00030 [Candidatus Woesearchaeota archaeon CG10_big_fil_rev_8_21_14_0_10_30_7]|nr:MAG: hypothetical protein COV11_00030 [Candidatus Woesearchaeota archaeon CG10_big_fil_rev_8_21_14_0_10_30_7]